MSGHAPSASLSTLLSDSQSRSGVRAYIAAGVAWVMRAVETTPVASPASSAISAIVLTTLPLPQTPGSTVWSMPIVSFLVFTPVVIAVALGAESVTCASDE